MGTAPSDPFATDAIQFEEIKSRLIERRRSFQLDLCESVSDDDVIDMHNACVIIEVIDFNEKITCFFLEKSCH
jgi:hypothetical protein